MSVSIQSMCLNSLTTQLFVKKVLANGKDIIKNAMMQKSLL